MSPPVLIEVLGLYLHPTEAPTGGDISPQGREYGQPLISQLLSSSPTFQLLSLIPPVSEWGRGGGRDGEGFTQLMLH